MKHEEKLRLEGLIHDFADRLQAMSHDRLDAKERKELLSLRNRVKKLEALIKAIRKLK